MISDIENDIIKNLEEEISFLQKRIDRKQTILRDFRESIGIRACARCGADISEQKGGTLCFVCWNDG